MRSRQPVRFLALALALLAGYAAPARAAQPPDVSASLVRIFTVDASGKEKPLNAGFFVASDLIATTFQQFDVKATFVARREGAGAETLKVRPHAWDNASGLLLMRVEGATGTAIDLADSLDRSIGDRVWVRDGGRSKSEFREATLTEFFSSPNDVPFFWTTARKAEAGTPVLDEEGRVLGVALGTYGGKSMPDLILAVDRLRDAIDGPSGQQIFKSASAKENGQALTDKVLAGKATKRVTPSFPDGVSVSETAVVVVEVVVSENGKVEKARAIKGPIRLAPSAVEAARQFVFTPTLQNGKPVKVIGTISFNFHASRGQEKP